MKKPLDFTYFTLIVFTTLTLVASCSQMPDSSLNSNSKINSTSVEDQSEVSNNQVSEPVANNINIKTPPTSTITKTRPNSNAVKKYCKKLDRYFAKYNWGKSGCDDFTWHHVRSSYLGNPIIWYVFGDEELAKKQNINTTLIMCGVHGDEITPVKFCFDLLDDLKTNPQLVENQLVIIAPLVAPDSFLKRKPTRTNARGVDVNRNFPTSDWSAKAQKMWASRYNKDKRRFPGKHALSEQETIFQVNLINRYNPQKVVSVHAPLTLLDYDGPSFSQDKGVVAKELLIQMSDAAGKYKISNYPFFPGSLGNWAGNERRIPTFTLELPNSDWNKTDRYFKLFRTAIHHAIKHDLNVHLIDEKVSASSNKKKSKDSKKIID